MKPKSGIRRHNTAIKGCPRCKKLVPTATRYCRCGFDFKRPKPDEKSAPATPTAETSRRKSERRQRITVKPDFYSPSDYENPFKKQRRRTASDTSLSDDSIKRKRGRPRQLSGLVACKPPVRSQSASPAVKEAKKGAQPQLRNTPKPSNGEVKESKKDRDKEQEFDMYASVPPEKQLQYTVILAEINRKLSGQVFKPV